MTPHEILGIEPGATPDEIAKAYRRRARETHPDKEGGSAEAFREVQEAYEELSTRKDTTKRRLLDSIIVDMLNKYSPRGNLVEQAKEDVRQEIANAGRQLAALIQKRQHIASYRGRVKGYDGYEDVVFRALEEVNAQIAQQEKSIEAGSVLLAALGELQDVVVSNNYHVGAC